MKKQSILVICLIALCFLLAVSRLETGRREQGREQLEDALRRTAVSCYALEGFYPPNVAYMEDNYGLSYDKEHYTVHYEVLAANLMPEITVLDNDK